ncbi:MAG: amidohydrolase family protein, partial [Rhodospirillales bacterium]|nr:amidohydrolase family protein [Rhodospirillales bacterium]
MDYDIKITGGTIIDGTGAARRAGDIGIHDGKIVAVGEAPGRANSTIDAAGRVVAPGFLDIHTHYDAQVMWDPMLTVSPWHGVTSVVMGNCGFGIAPTRPGHRDLMARTLEKVEGMSVDALSAGLGDWPFETFPEYLRAVEQRGVSINVAALLGHTPLRLYVMGLDSVERAATADEIAAMRTLAAEAIAAGAVGISSSKSNLHLGFGGFPVPSRLAEFDETLALAGVMGDAGRGVFQLATGRYPDHDEMAEIARRTGRPVTWTALLTRSDEGRKYIDGHLKTTAEQRARG